MAIITIQLANLKYPSNYSIHGTIRTTTVSTYPAILSVYPSCTQPSK